MKANSFKFESATLTYEGYKKCPQYFNFRGASTIYGVLDAIYEQGAPNKYQNKLCVCLSYGDVGMVVTIDYDSNDEVYVLTDKGVHLPLTEKYDILVDAGTRTYICGMNKYGKLEWNEWAEKTKKEDDKFIFVRAEMELHGRLASPQVFNFADDNTLSDVLDSALSTCYTGDDRLKLNIDLKYRNEKIHLTLYFGEQILVYAESNIRICVPITTEIERTLEAGENTYVWSVDGEGEYDTEEDVIEAKEALEAKENKEDVEAKEDKEDVRSYNVGASDYAKHKIQPWSIWLEYNLNPWDADIVKRVLRTKETDGRKLDYEKIIHICKERIRQIEKYGK